MSLVLFIHDNIDELTGVETPIVLCVLLQLNWYNVLEILSSVTLILSITDVVRTLIGCNLTCLYTVYLTSNLLKMSVLVTYSVYDLTKETEILMNTLYHNVWSEECSLEDEDFLFDRIKVMHGKIMLDSEIKEYNRGATTLFDITNRLYLIENTLVGSAEPIGNVATIRTCISRTKKLVSALTESNRHFCIIS